MKKLIMVVLCLMLIGCGGEVFAESIDISSFGFGVGIAQQSKQDSAKPCLETHYFLDGKINKKDVGYGPFIFIVSDKEIKETQSLGYGFMVGFRINDKDNPGKLVSSFNLGLGFIKEKFNLVFSTSF